jgi:hypothetical protein
VVAFRPASARPSSVRRPSTLTLNDISLSTAEPILSKVHRNVPLVVTFKNCSKILIPYRTLVAMATDTKNLKYLLLKKPKEVELRYLA